MIVAMMIRAVPMMRAGEDDDDADDDDDDDDDDDGHIAQGRVVVGRGTVSSSLGYLPFVLNHE
jgi:hypothetical protein